jgi:hypothetical protein
MGDLRTPYAIVDALGESPAGTVEPLAIPWFPARHGDTASHRFGDHGGGPPSRLRLASPQPLGHGPSGSANPLGEDVEAQSRIKLRRVFILLSEYFRQSRRGPERRQLADLIDDTVVMARDCFATAALRNGVAHSVDAEHERCLGDLLGFVDALRDGRVLSDMDVAHAMDGLIVQCVLLDIQHQAAPQDV